MTKLFCEECNEIPEFVYIDGYNFGDRLMEGVNFKLKFSNKTVECIGVEEQSEVYMKQFNWEYWKERCNLIAKDYDVFTCPKCGEDIYDEDQLVEPPEAIKIELTSPSEVFSESKTNNQEGIFMTSMNAKDFVDDLKIPIIDQLKKVLEKHGYKYKTKIIIDVIDEKGKPLFSLYPDDKYLQFHDEFTQIGYQLPGIDEIEKITKKDHWESNHD